MGQGTKLNLKNNSSTYIKLFGVLSLLCALSVFLFAFGMNYIFEKERTRADGGDRLAEDYVSTLKMLHEETGADYPSLVQTLKNSPFMPFQRFELVESDKKVSEEAIHIEEKYWLVSRHSFFDGKGPDGNMERHPMPPPPFAPGKPQMGSPPHEMRPPPMMGPPNGFRDHPPPKPPKVFFFLSLGLLFFIFLFVISCSAFAVIYFGLRQAQEASKVMRDLKGGNLKARLPDFKIKPLAGLVSEFNKMADEVEGLVTLLRNTDNNRRKMLQELAHDLRTPLASMKSLIETLSDNGDKISVEEQKKLFSVVLSEVEYFHRLVDDLLFLSGVHDLRFRGSFESISLVDVINKQLSIFTQSCPKIHFDLQAEGTFEIKGNLHLIERLLKNAISNASHYAVSKIVIKLLHVGEKIELAIEDDGPGLDHDELLHFGEKKYSRKLTSGPVEGHISIGLGSVIMKHICSLHEAQMILENIQVGDERKGARLKFIF